MQQLAQYLTTKVTWIIVVPLLGSDMHAVYFYNLSECFAFDEGQIFSRKTSPAGLMTNLGREMYSGAGNALCI